MLKKYCFALLFALSGLTAAAAQNPVNLDSLHKILSTNDEALKEKNFIIYVKNIFAYSPLSTIDVAKKTIDQVLPKYTLQNKTAIVYFLEGIYQRRKENVRLTENALLKAIERSVKKNDHYLLYTTFTHLAFLQTSQGYTVEALSSFRRAKKEAILLNDPYIEAIIDINISDIYYRNSFYSQSLFYLDQAEGIMAKHNIQELRLKNILNMNKAENFFRMGKLDSLNKYDKLLNQSESTNGRIGVYRKRSGYYVDLLKHNYADAITKILTLKNDTTYNYEDLDEQYLGTAYFHAGKPDSARIVINGLLRKKTQRNHPEITLHLYEILGETWLGDGKNKEAAENFKEALQQAKNQISRLTQVDTIASQIKMDELQDTYIQKEEVFKRERLWLLFVAVVALFTLAIVGMFYRNIRQKRYYEKLLFATEKEELAFINSHEVRRHLSNILGLTDLIKHTGDNGPEYDKAVGHLHDEAENLDNSLKNFSNKLG